MTDIYQTTPPELASLVRDALTGADVQEETDAVPGRIPVEHQKLVNENTELF